jgi:hypothetical protein
VKIEPEVKDIDIAEGWHELEFLEQIAALKATVTVPDVAQLLGLEADEGDKIPSPWNPTERTPSCHLYEDHFYDYASGRGGDIFDLVIAVNPAETLESAVKALRNKAVSAGKQYGDVEAAVPREILDFGPQLGNYQELREWEGIPLDYGVRKDFEGNIYVPHRDPGGTYAVKVRHVGGGKSSWAGSQLSHRLYDPFGWNPGYTPKPDLVLVEGESDAWAMLSVAGNQVDVLALPAGVGTYKDHWYNDLAPYYRVFVCTDNDKAGKEGLNRLLLKVGYARAEPLRVPQLFNDAREAIAAGWRPDFV